jgi:hypothetical protein
VRESESVLSECSGSEEPPEEVHQVSACPQGPKAQPGKKEKRIG